MWIAVIVMAAVSTGYYLFNITTTSSEVTNSMILARSTSSYYTQDCPVVILPSGPLDSGCYMVDLRVTNSYYKTLTKLSAYVEGVDSPAIVIWGGARDVASGDYDLWRGTYVFSDEVNLQPRHSTDVLVLIYTDSPNQLAKALTLKAEYSDGKTASLSVALPG